MTHYRIYILDANGRIAAGHDASCGGGEEVRQLAAAMLGSATKAEIWCGTRLVGAVGKPAV